MVMFDGAMLVDFFIKSLSSLVSKSFVGSRINQDLPIALKIL